MKYLKKMLAFSLMLGILAGNIGGLADSMPSNQKVQGRLLEMSFINATPFSEGLAWVQGNLDNGHRTAIVNKSSDIIYSTDESVIYFSPFKDSYSFFIVCDNASYDESYGFYIDDPADQTLSYRFRIINNEGEITFKQEDSDITTLIAHGDGMFAVSRYIAGMKEKRWELGIIDAYGDVILPFEEYEMGGWKDTKKEKINSNNFRYFILNSSSAWNKLNVLSKKVFDRYFARQRYMGNGIFDISSINSLAQRDRLLFDGKKGELTRYDWGDDMTIFSDIIDGKMLVMDSGSTLSGNTYIRKMDMNGRFGNIENEPASIGRNPYNAMASVSRSAYYGSVQWNSGLRWIYKPGSIRSTDYSDNLFYILRTYRDFEWNTILSFPAYEGLDFCGGPFSQGYASLIIKGMDSEIYYTIIDRSGAEQFDPIVVQHAHDRLYDGYGIIHKDDEYFFINTRGELSEPLPKPSVQHSDIPPSGWTFQVISEGIFIISESYDPYNNYFMGKGKVGQKIRYYNIEDFYQ